MLNFVKFKLNSPTFIYQLKLVLILFVRFHYSIIKLKITKNNKLLKIEITKWVRI